MKKLIIPLFISCMVLFPACNQELLEIPQKGVVTTETFYQTDEDAEAALVAAYQGFLWNITTKEGGNIYAPFRACFNLCGDDIYAAGSNFGDNDFMGAMNEFRYDNGSEVIRNCYQNIYYAMYYSNLVIDHFKEGTSATQKRAVAEARVLRAWMHMMLAIGWDCPPLVDHLLAGDAEPFNCNAGENPKSHNELLVWCAEECEAALADLTERAAPSDKDGAVKVTKGFANAVAGKAYLFAGEYAKAKTALKKVIDSGRYALVDGDKYWQNFHIEGDANEEKVFEINLELNAGVPVYWDIVNRSTWMEANIWNWRSDHFVANPSSSYSSIDGWGGCGVPKAFADEFVANDGLESYRLNATLINIEDVVYNSVYNSEAIDGLTLEQKKTSAALGIGELGLYGQSFWLPLKPVARWQDLENFGSNVRVNNFTIMRYAEVLLLYAEACVQTSAAGEALPYIQMIQNRAGSQTISQSVDMAVIEKEKKFELWLESCRWPDMVRWGKFDVVAKAGDDVPNLYDKVSRPVKDGDQGIIWQHGSEANSRFYTVTSHGAKDRGDVTGFKAGKHEHFPYPYNEIAVNPNLVQNPGWE